MTLPLLGVQTFQLSGAVSCAFSDAFGRGNEDPITGWTTPSLYKIVSNRARTDTNNVWDYCVQALAGGCLDIYAQAVLHYVSENARVGLAARWADATHMFLFYLGPSGPDAWLVDINVGWVDSDFWNTTVASGQLCKLECNGTAIKGYVAGTERVSITSSNHASDLNVCMAAQQSGGTGDQAEWTAFEADSI